MCCTQQSGHGGSDVACRFLAVCLGEDGDASCSLEVWSDLNSSTASFLGSCRASISDAALEPQQLCQAYCLMHARCLPCHVMPAACCQVPVSADGFLMWYYLNSIPLFCRSSSGCGRESNCTVLCSRLDHVWNPCNPKRRRRVTLMLLAAYFCES